MNTTRSTTADKSVWCALIELEQHHPKDAEKYVSALTSSVTEKIFLQGQILQEYGIETLHLQQQLDGYVNANHDPVAWLILGHVYYLYFPVKRVVFMPLRACHRVRLFPAAVYGGQELLSVRARCGTGVCGAAQAAPPSLPHARWQGAAGACPTSASVHDPSSPWAEQAGSPRDTSRWPLPPAPVRAAADDSLEPRQIDVRRPPSAWPSGAALPPASGRDRRPAAGHRSTAATCCGGGARQRAAHASARCSRSAPPAAPRRRPS